MNVQLRLLGVNVRADGEEILRTVSEEVKKKHERNKSAPEMSSDEPLVRASIMAGLKATSNQSDSHENKPLLTSCHKSEFQTEQIMQTKQLN